MLALSLKLKSQPSFPQAFFFFITRKLRIGKQYNSLQLSFDLNVNIYKVQKKSIEEGPQCVNKCPI